MHRPARCPSFINYTADWTNIFDELFKRSLHNSSVGAQQMTKQTAKLRNMNIIECDATKRLIYWSKNTVQSRCYQINGNVLRVNQRYVH
jgi:hypothetical protein